MVSADSWTHEAISTFCKPDERLSKNFTRFPSLFSISKINLYDIIRSSSVNTLYTYFMQPNSRWCNYSRYICLDWVDNYIDVPFFDNYHRFTLVKQWLCRSKALSYTIREHIHLYFLEDPPVFQLWARSLTLVSLQHLLSSGQLIHCWTFLHVWLHQMSDANTTNTTITIAKHFLWNNK